MKFRDRALRVGVIGFLITMPYFGGGAVRAATVPPLVISQFKVTSSNGQFVMLYNQTDGNLDLGNFELDYTSSSNKTSSVSMAGILPSHTYYILADDAVQMCYRSVVNATSLGFTTTGGSLRLWQVSTTDTTKTMSLEDTVNWTNKNGSLTASPLQLSTLAQVSYLRQPDSPDGTQVTAPGAGSWNNVTTSSSDPCVLLKVADDTPIAPPEGTLLASGDEPPATIVSLANTTSGKAAPHLPVKDVGLAAPSVTELLPNPAGIGTDATDEFIELYNSNAVPFDLSGFILETGLTTKHKYTFPAGTMLPAKGFGAFYSDQTGLSLSNTSGQAALFDPFGNSLSQSDVYTKSKDGMAWALAKGAWYWTAKPTPKAANLISQTSSIKTASDTKAAAAVKGASTHSSGLQGGGAADGTADDTGAPAPIHPLVLAAVAALAVGYGVYEYRNDLGNKFHQFRADRAARRKARG